MIFQFGIYEELPVLAVTNRDQSNLLPEKLPRFPSYMKHIGEHYPPKGLLKKVLHGLMESFPYVD